MGVLSFGSAARTLFQTNGQKEIPPQKEELCGAKKILIVGDHLMPYKLIQRRMAAMEIGIYHVELLSESLDLFITQE